MAYKEEEDPIWPIMFIILFIAFLLWIPICIYVL